MMIYVRQSRDYVPFFFTSAAFLLLGYILGQNSEQHIGIAIGGFREYNSDSTLRTRLNQCQTQRMRDEKPDQDDPELVIYARKHFLIAPPHPSIPYNLTTPFKYSDRSQFGQGRIMRDIFTNIIKSTDNGFYIEVGAHDGEAFSNTLWFERNWNWTGLLIETDRAKFSELTTKNRRAWLANLCLSPTEYAGKYSFFENVGTNDSSGSGLHQIRYNGEKREAKIYCVPLFTLLLALNQTVIDIFSLDIEGAELDILKTIPFDKVHFKVLTIETEWIPGGNGANEVKTFLNQHGYKLYNVSYDSIYVNEAYLPEGFREYGWRRKTTPVPLRIDFS